MNWKTCMFPFTDGLEADPEIDEDERQRIAAQLADPKETDLDYLLQRADEQSSRGRETYNLDTIL